MPDLRVVAVSAVNDLRAEALFCSPLQPSDAPTFTQVDDAITAALLTYTAEGCSGLLAQEFGDHPEAAAQRMRWCRTTVVYGVFAVAV